MVTTVTRTRLKQLWGPPLEQWWKTLPDSDPERHFKCGYIPTGTQCPACGKPLGPVLENPYSYQIDFLADDHMTCMGTGGEQGGKSHSSAMKLYQIIMGFLGEYAEQGKAAGEVAWLVADPYELTYQEFHNLEDWLKSSPFEVTASKRVDPGEIIVKVPGGVFVIKTRSASDARTLRAESPIVVLLCEGALISFDAYERLISRVARARKQFPGFGAIILSGTFEGSIGW